MSENNEAYKRKYVQSRTLLFNCPKNNVRQKQMTTLRLSYTWDGMEGRSGTEAKGILGISLQGTDLPVQLVSCPVRSTVHSIVSRDLSSARLSPFQFSSPFFPRTSG